MSPEPIIDLQRRLTLAGSIHAGGEKTARGPGKKLEAWRLTSPRRALVEQAAQLYGGTVTAWTSPVGEEWQVYTQAESIPVLLMPSYSLRQTYELWEGATKRSRVCDGVDEQLTGGACLCNAEGVDRCDIYTRLVVALPELDSVLGWRLISKGIYAAHELPTTVALAERISSGSTFVPMQLRLDNRRGVKDGQVVRFVVPVLDLGVGYLALAGRESSDGTRALLPAAGSFVPAEPRAAPAERLPDAEAPALAPRGRAPAFGAVSDDFGPAPEPPPAPAAPFATPIADERGTKPLTDAQSKKLNVLVGPMREAGEITTENLYAAVAKMRGVDREEIVLAVGGFDEEGGLHWAPLRDSLTRVEAMDLIDRLAALRAKQRATVPQGPGDFPPGY